jgi:hypothetical protein
MNRLKAIGMSILLIQNLTTTMLTVRSSIIAMARVAIDDVRYAIMMMLFINLHVLNCLKMLGLDQPLVNSLILLLFGGYNMARNILMTYHKLGLL